jgi:DNA-binding transcriptional regulator YiaG
MCKVERNKESKAMFLKKHTKNEGVSISRIREKERMVTFVFAMI